MFSVDAAMKVLMPFYLDPMRGRHLREIARNCAYSYERVHAWAGELEKEGLLTATVRGRIKEYKINKSSHVLVKLFALLDLEKQKEFFHKRPGMRQAVNRLKNQLVEGAGEPIETMLISGIPGEKKGEVKIYLLANQTLGLPAYNEVEKICKNCSKEFNFLIYVDTLQQFRAKWLEDKEYRKMWLNGTRIYGEETFWQEFLKIENKMETTL